MHGLGDSIHQRAVLRQLSKTREIWLETSWPAIYHDMPEVHLVRKAVGLHTQSANAEREAKKYGPPPPMRTPAMKVMYHGKDVMNTQSKSVLEAMCRQCGVDFASADYRLPVPEAWIAKARALLPGWDGVKRLLVYRPLVARPEWRGSMARNANETHYAQIVAYLRNHFHVVSVAVLKPGTEWTVGPVLKADTVAHEGQFDNEALIGLFKLASLVVTSSGFAAILAPAVGTPCVSIVGGYEDAHTHDTGARFAPFLSIEPKVPCRCWTSTCPARCTKEIEMLPAIDKLAAFMREHFAIEILPMAGVASEMHTYPAVQPGPLARPFPAPPAAAAQRQAFHLQMQSRGLKA